MAFRVYDDSGQPRVLFDVESEEAAISQYQGETGSTLEGLYAIEEPDERDDEGEHGVD